MLKAVPREAGFVREHAHLAGDFAGRQVAHEAHLAGEAERAGHRAADLRGNAERLRRRVRDEDRLDLPAVVELSRNLVVPSDDVCFASTAGV